MKHLGTVILLLIGAQNFAGAFQNATSWRLSTADTTMVVALLQGIPAITHLSPTKTGFNWLLAPAPEILPASVIVQGASVATKWQYDGGAFDAQSGQLVLRFSNRAPALELQSIWRARPGHGPIEHWLTIANRSAAAITLGHQDSLVLSNIAIPKDESMDAWWIKRGAGNSSTEGGSYLQSVGQRSSQTLASDPTDGASPVPWLALQVGTSRGLYVGWEFSAVGRISYGSTSGGEGETATKLAKLQIKVGNLPVFKTDVPAAETFLVPPAFVGCYLGDIDDGSYTLHRFVLEKLVPKFPSSYAHPTLAYNLYLDVGGANANEANVLKSATLAKELGFETFVVDAMWFPQSGDWRWDPKRFPRGSQPIADYVHSNGMKFGLWMAYTQGSDAEDPRALSISKHADWFFAPPKLDPQGHINWDALIDLGSNPARDWAKNATQQAVADYKLDYFKTDYSPIVTTCRQTTHRHHYGVDVSYWSTLGYYSVQEAMMRNYPDLILEGCSGSGHIKDFGDVQRVHIIAINDTLSSLPNRQAIYDSSFAFPPSILMDYTYESYYNDVSDAPEPYLWRSSMMNQWQMDPTNSASWTPDQRAKVKRATDVYKSWIRPILQDAVVHHILPRPDGYHWDGMFYWSPSLRHGTLYIFRPNSDTPAQTILLKGLEPDVMYQVRAEDHSTPEKTYSGQQLMSSGLRISLPAKLSSDLVYLEEAR